jgi:hypothetical protein
MKGKKPTFAHDPAEQMRVGNCKALRPLAGPRRRRVRRALELAGAVQGTAGGARRSAGRGVSRDDHGGVH